MQVLVHTDHSVEGGQELLDRIAADVESGLAHLADRLVRLDVHLAADVAGHGDADTFRCTLRTEPRGLNAAATTHHASTPEEAVAGATERLRHLLQHEIDRQGHVKGTATIRDWSEAPPTG